MLNVAHAPLTSRQITMLAQKTEGQPIGSLPTSENVRIKLPAYRRLVGPKEALGCNRALLAVLWSEPFCVTVFQRKDGENNFEVRSQGTSLRSNYNETEVYISKILQRTWATSEPTLILLQLCDAIAATQS